MRNDALKKIRNETSRHEATRHEATRSDTNRDDSLKLIRDDSLKLIRDDSKRHEPSRFETMRGESTRCETKRDDATRCAQDDTIRYELRRRETKRADCFRRRIATKGLTSTAIEGMLLRSPRAPKQSLNSPRKVLGDFVRAASMPRARSQQSPESRRIGGFGGTGFRIAMT